MYAYVGRMDGWDPFISFEWLLKSAALSSTSLSWFKYVYIFGIKKKGGKKFSSFISKEKRRKKLSIYLLKCHFESRPNSSDWKRKSFFLVLFFRCGCRGNCAQFWTERYCYREEKREKAANCRQRRRKFPTEALALAFELKNAFRYIPFWFCVVHNITIFFSSSSLLQWGRFMGFAGGEKNWRPSFLSLVTNKHI